MNTFVGFLPRKMHSSGKLGARETTGEKFSTTRVRSIKLEFRKFSSVGLFLSPEYFGSENFKLNFFRKFKS